jgi:uncharacterized protein YgiB involved in biofilm formation
MESVLPTTGLLKQTLESAEPQARKSRAVPLVLAASALLAGCGPRQARDEYASQEDCKKDWGRPELCQPASGTGSSGGHSGYYGRYYGPSYDEGARESAQRSGGNSFGLAGGESSNHSVGRSVSRGGFGGAHISSAGG